MNLRYTWEIDLFTIEFAASGTWCSYDGDKTGGWWDIHSVEIDRVVFADVGYSADRLFSPMLIVFIEQCSDGFDWVEV